MIRNCDVSGELWAQIVEQIGDQALGRSRAQLRVQLVGKLQALGLPGRMIHEDIFEEMVKRESV